MFLKRTNIRVTEGRFALNPACRCRVREKGPGSCLPEGRTGLQVWTEPEGSALLSSLEAGSLFLNLIHSQSLEECLCKVQVDFFSLGSVQGRTRHDILTVSPVIRTGPEGGVHDSFLNWGA